MFEVIVVDDASPEPVGGRAAGRRPACASSAIAQQPGLHRHLQSRRGARARRVRRVPQQRHDRHAGLARGAAARVRDAPRRRPRRRQARLPGRPPAGGGRHRLARRLGVELRPQRRSRPARVQLPARGRTTAPARASRSRPRSSASSAASTRATRPAYYEDADLAFAVRAAGRKVYYQPAATDRALRGPDLGHRRRRRASSATRSSTRRRSRPSGRRRSPTHRANGIAAELERDRWAKLRVLVIDACMLTPDHDAGSVRMLAILEILTSLRCKVTFVADNLEHRQPYVVAAAAARRRGAVPSVRALDRRPPVQARRRVRHHRDVAPLHRGEAHRRRARVRAARRWSCSTPSTCTSCAASGRPSSRAARSRARRRAPSATRS